MSDPTTHTDGLADLKARATATKKAAPKQAAPKRVIPASQNPTPLPPYVAPEDPPAPPKEASPASAKKAPAPPVAPASEATPTAAAAAPAKPTSHKVGLYIDDAHGDFFEAVRAAGQSQKPRVTLTSSAVVRLAMDRLIADLGAEGVRDALLAKPIDPTAVGRRRR